VGLSKFINQECKCIIQSVWITAAWQHISPEVAVKSAAYPVEWMGLMMCCGVAEKRMGILRVSVRGNLKS